MPVIVKIKKRISNIKYAINKVKERAEWASKKYNISRARLIVGFLWCGLFYGANTIDYFLCKFFLLNRKGKKQFVTICKQNKYEKKTTKEKAEFTYHCKEETLYRFKDYMKRDWCGQIYRNKEEDYKSFAAKHSKGIIKPVGDYGGHGIKIIPTDEIDGMDLFSYCTKNNVMIEELIIQHEDVNLMYPNAINTIRIITNNGKCIGAAFRMGTGGGCNRQRNLWRNFCGS